jgi:hypothetical protein
MPANPADKRKKSRQTENEDMKPVGDGQSPRPATEPAGSEGSSRNSKTKTDPATGES